MKHLFYIVFACLISVPVFAGSYAISHPTDTTSKFSDKLVAAYLIEEGKQLFYDGKIKDAMRKFREAYVRDNKNYKAALWIGEAHYKLDNYGYALKYGKIAEVLSAAEDGGVFFLLARSYHRLNVLDSAAMDYDLAKMQLSKFKQNAYGINQKIKEVKYAISLKNIPSKYERKLLDDHVNSGYDDYSALLANDGKSLYYVSRRPNTTGGNVNPADQQYFEDIYVCNWNENSLNWDASSNKIERMNSDGFDAIGFISLDGNRAYLTLNTSFIDTKSATRSSDIAVSKYTKKGRWTKARTISNKSINTSFFDGAPSLTADENTMYFVSDRQGDKSLSDIYVVEKIDTDWGEAKRLPAPVNSNGNETTPYITPNGKYLFFSSDNRKGMGGYDVYVTYKDEYGKWVEPINLGKDFNTVNNDIYFRFYPKQNKAFISTFRLQGMKASIDIFEINVKDWKIVK